MKRFLSFLLSALMVLSLVATAGIMVVAADHEPAVDTTVDAATVSVYDGTPDYSWFVSADGTGTLTYVDATEYTLTKADEFMGFANLVNGAAKVTYVDSSTSTETTAAVPAQRFTGKTIKLGKNLVINQGDADTWTKETTGLYEWVPIGHDKGSGSGTSSVNLTFQGTFDGQDHYISGVFSNSKWSNNTQYKAVGAKGVPADGRDNGFFFHASNGAVIKNFSIINSAFINAGKGGTDFQGNSSVCTRITGKVTIENIYSDAYVNGLWGTGAIVGYANKSYTNQSNSLDCNYVKNCVFTGTLVKETTNTNRSGGFALMVGCIEGVYCYIEDNLFAGDLKGNTKLWNSGKEHIGVANSKLAYIKNCQAIINGKTLYNDADYSDWTQTTNNLFGGIVPTKPYTLYQGLDMNSYDLYEASQATDDNMYGWFTVDANGKATVKTYTLNSAEAFIGFRNLVNGEGKGWHDADADSVIDDGEIIAVAAQPFADIARVDKGTKPGEASNAKSSEWYVTSVSNQITVKLGVNIVLNEGDASTWTKDTTGLYEWIPIGHNNIQLLPFSGIFDGDGKYISGVFSPAKWDSADVGCPGSVTVSYTTFDGKTATKSGQGWTAGRDNGLFGGTSGATLKNFAVINSTFINWYSSGNYQGNGSLVSRANSGTKIDNVYSDAYVTGTYGVGGLVGFVGGNSSNLGACSITNCIYAGTLTKANQNASHTAFGVLVGVNESKAMTVTDCVFAGTLNGSTLTDGEFYTSRHNSVGSIIYDCRYVGADYEAYTNWVELEGDIAVPAAAWNVAKKSFKDIEMSFVQETDVVEGEYTIRLASEIFNLGATTAGYEIKVGDIWVELGSSTTVYKSLNAKGGDGQIAKIQADYGKYYTAIELIADAGSEVIFTVRPYIVIESETTYGTAYTITYDAEGAFVSAVAAN